VPGWLFRPVVQHQQIVLTLFVVPPLVVLVLFVLVLVVSPLLLELFVVPQLLLELFVVSPLLLELFVVPQLLLELFVIFQLVWPQRSHIVSVRLLRAGLRRVLRQERNMLEQWLL
jgi:hypothetical protein